MVVWLIGAIGTTGEVMSSAQSGAEQAGATIGTAIGFSMIIGIWAVGDIILGLFVKFTEPRK